MTVAKLLHKRNGQAQKACPVVFMGENAEEVKTASQSGMIGILVGEGSWEVGPGKYSFFYPIPLMRKLAHHPKVVKPTGPRLETQ